MRKSLQQGLLFLSLVFRYLLAVGGAGLGFGLMAGGQVFGVLVGAISCFAALRYASALWVIMRGRRLA